MKIIVVSPRNKSVFNFRGDLIRDMISCGNDVYVVGPNREYIDEVMALGVKEFIEIPFVKDNTSVGGDMDYYKRLRKVMRDVKPDMLFAYTIKPVIYGSLAAYKEGVKKIFPMVTGLGRVYASNHWKTRLVRFLTNRLYKKAFKRVTRVMFQNGDDVDDLVRYGCIKREKCAIVNGSGVNMARFARSPIPEKPVFLMVSRILREKGVLEFAQAARIVKKEVPDARFIVLGAYDKSFGALKEEDVREFIEDGSVEFPGEVKDPVSFFAGCSVFVLPSYYREGLPRTILEGMACGRPIITTDWVGCREPIEDGVNGFLVPIKNASELAKKMLVLATDRQKTLDMSDAAYKTCAEKYEVGVVNAQMRAIMGYDSSTGPASTAGTVDATQRNATQRNATRARGRDAFRKFRRVIELMTRCYSILPEKKRAALLMKHRRTRGKLGMAIRYALLKSLAVECGSNVAIYEDVYFYNPQNLRIGDNVSIHPMCYVECGKSKEKCLRIGNDVSIAHGVTIMSNTHVYDDPEVNIKDQPTVTKQIIIGSNVWFGAKVTVLPGVTIGDGVVVGANSVVTKNIPDNKVVVGAPAKAIKDRIA